MKKYILVIILSFILLPANTYADDHTSFGKHEAIIKLDNITTVIHDGYIFCMSFNNTITYYFVDNKCSDLNLGDKYYIEGKFFFNSNNDKVVAVTKFNALTER